MDIEHYNNKVTNRRQNYSRKFLQALSSLIANIHILIKVSTVLHREIAVDRHHCLVLISTHYHLLSVLIVMRIIKLTLFPVPVRYRYIEMSSFSHHVLLYLRTLYSLEPGETPNNSASHKVPNYAQRY